MGKNDSCRNCLFFKPHYAENNEGEMYMLETGHCEHPRIRVMQFRRCIKYNGSCYYWEAVNQTESPKESINDIIKNMATRIEQIATHLNIE